MAEGINRTEILRMDCPDCKTKGYVVSGTVESACSTCGGSGMLEKEVPFKFDGPRTVEEKAAIFEVDPDTFRDTGHDVPKRQLNGNEEAV